MRRLLVFVCLLAGACSASLPAPSPTQQPTPTARVTLRTVGLGDGLVVDVPVSWSLDGMRGVNRGTQRLLLAGNTDLTAVSTLVGNGDVDAAGLQSGQATVEIESFCRLSCSGPTEETALPLDWTRAAPLNDRVLPSGRHELAVGFRWFGRPMFVVARWADDAPAADIAAIAAVARSVRADPPMPAIGEYQGWAGLGPVADIPAGSVRLVPLPTGAIVRPPYRVWDNEPFFIVREPQGIVAFSSKPLVDRRCVVAFNAPTDRFSCTVDGRTFSWTRRGGYLGPEPASDMRPLTVVVRDGSAWVAYSD
jgi:hypothetical protein